MTDQLWLMTVVVMLPSMNWIPVHPVGAPLLVNCTPETPIAMVPDALGKANVVLTDPVTVETSMFCTMKC